jgi:4-amino-4-deoxy-L-arabinose transferase-like glycosyltransferase
VQPVAWAGLLGIGALLTALLIAVAGRYGYHRDELYFLAAADHLAWGYVDQPPLTPALAWLGRALFGDSLTGLRLVSALAMGAVVVLTGLIARELGGSRAVQLLAGACIAGCGVTLAVGHLLSTATFDVLLWTVVLFPLVRLLRTREPRLWLVVGAAAGVGLLNKVSVLQLAGTGLLGMLTSREGRGLLATRWFAGGVAIALALWAPYLAWQAGHGWPQLEIFADLREEDGGLVSGLLFLPLQLPMTNPLLAPIWIVGVVALLRDPRLRPWRPLAIGFLLFVAFYVVVGGKPYYAFGWYPVLFGAGLIRLERWRGDRGQGQLRPVRHLAYVAVAALIPVPLLLPILPASAIPVTSAVNEDTAETFAWPAYVEQIEAVVAGLTPAERAGVVVVTGNYGEAGALERFAGPELRDRVYSGHNSYWFWGPPSGDGEVVVVVGYNRARDWLAQRFDSVTLATRLDNAALNDGEAVDNEEQGQPVWIARGLREPWATGWLGWRHYDG